MKATLWSSGSSRPNSTWLSSTSGTSIVSRPMAGGSVGFTVGHEIGHWILHAEALRSGTLSMFDGERIWCRDGSPHPVERQAEMFSAALLMPRDLVRAALPSASWHGWGPVYRLADAFVVSVTAMKIRLEKLGWMHIDEGTPVSGPQPAPGQAALFPTT